MIFLFSSSFAFHILIFVKLHLFDIFFLFLVSLYEEQEIDGYFP